MVGTSTARLTLYKPDPADNVDVNQDLNANADKVDLLGKNALPITNPFIKRNTADAVASGTDLMFETLTVVLKTNRWYEAGIHFRYNTANAVNTTPNGGFDIHLKAGGSVAVGDPSIVNGGLANISNTSPTHHAAGTFDVPADGTYTLGLSANSGGANTVNILASGGADNTGNKRCLWVKDLGEK